MPDSATTSDKEKQVISILKDSEVNNLMERFHDNRTLSELHLHCDKWPELVENWKGDREFEREIISLVHAGLVLLPNNDKMKAELTEIGIEVASKLEKERKLWNQRNLK